MASSSPAGPSAPAPHFKVTFKKWTAVAVWKWITPNDETECGICRLPFEGCCPDCKFPGDDCALGGCGLTVQFPFHTDRAVDGRGPDPVPCPTGRKELSILSLFPPFSLFLTYMHPTHCSIRSMSTQFSSTLHSEVVGGSADATTVSHV